MAAQGEAGRAFGKNLVEFGHVVFGHVAQGEQQQAHRGGALLSVDHVEEALNAALPAGGRRDSPQPVFTTGREVLPSRISSAAFTAASSPRSWAQGE